MAESEVEKCKEKLMKYKGLFESDDEKLDKDME